ncbi:MAG TPA: hypothetical protein VHL58_05975 [Thermoanaerobaculia bacterium]|nr:hypothetical protein [Thermoanaerobaculia bacterium]
MSSPKSLKPARWALLALMFCCSLPIARSGSAGLTPLIATIVLLAAAIPIIPSEELFATASLALPLEAFLSLALTNEATSRWAAGTVYALSVCVVVFAGTRDGRWSKGDAILLLAAVAAPLRLLPLDGLRSLPEVSILIGATLLIALLPSKTVTLEQLLLAFIVATVTPDFPLRASLFPAALATFAWLLVAPSPFTFAAAVLVALLAGKWSLPLLAVTCLASSLRNRGADAGGSRALLAPFAFGAASLARVFAIFPDFVSGLQSPASWLLAFVSMVAVLVFRPHLSLLYFIACAFMIVTIGKGEKVRVPVSLMAISFVCLSLTSWNGVTRATLALAIPSRTLLCVAILATIAVADAFPRLRLIAAGAVLMVGCSAFGAFSRGQSEALTEAFGLAPGESRSFVLPHPVAAISLIGSGAHMADVPSGTPLAEVEIIDSQHSVYRRQLTAGELSDWGFLRHDQIFQSRNAIPAEPSGIVTGEAGEAWLSGDGGLRLRAAKPIVGFTIIANPKLSPRARINFRGAEELR